jgi:hypothetical protein
VECFVAAWIRKPESNSDRIGCSITMLGRGQNVTGLNSGLQLWRAVFQAAGQSGAETVLGLDLCGRDQAARANPVGMFTRLQMSGSRFSGKRDFRPGILNQYDLPIFRRTIAKSSGCSKEQGSLHRSQSHPMDGCWKLVEKSAEEAACYLDRYFDEGERHWKMMGVDFTNFHRTLATYLDGFLQTGFTLERIVEPTVTKENLALYPELADELRVPNFIIYDLRKP